MTAGTLYGWGKLKVSGDNHMYPRPFEGLMGWTIHSMACGSGHFAVSAEYQSERSTITWCAPHADITTPVCQENCV